MGNRYGRPLDNGTYSFRTGGPGDPKNGANGDPDNDGVTNLQEYLNGTDPSVSNTGSGTPVGGITIGPKPANQQITVGAATNAGEFTDWTLEDLIALDAYDGNGGNHQSGDVYQLSDGFDSSRDIVAFYARDGGAAADDGDDKFYFRVDLHNLVANAEQGNLDIYVAINVGNAGPSGVGEMLLPDQVDCLTMMKWNVVVAAYGNASLAGRVYVDTNPAVNTTGFQNLADPQYGVQTRNVVSNGFGSIYYNHELDAVEFSISRQALLDAGWAGDPATLKYQVFTTKDGTGNSPAGAGDLPGPDITDSLRDSGIANDFRGDNNQGAKRQALINDPVASRLNSWVGLQADNDRGRRAKLVMLIHGNQAIRPGSFIQGYLDAGNGAAITARSMPMRRSTRASRCISRRPSPARSNGRRLIRPPTSPQDGPTLNARLKDLMEQGGINLLAGTFSDHILPYFSGQYNANNEPRQQTLSSIYTMPRRRSSDPSVSDNTILGRSAASAQLHLHRPIPPPVEVVRPGHRPQRRRLPPQPDQRREMLRHQRPAQRLPLPEHGQRPERAAAPAFQPARALMAAGSGCRPLPRLERLHLRHPSHGLRPEHPLDRQQAVDPSRHPGPDRQQRDRPFRAAQRNRRHMGFDQPRQPHPRPRLPRLHRLGVAGELQPLV